MTISDPLDIAILRHLQRSTRTTSEAIAEAVGLSPSACQRRIKRLRQCGAIASEIAVLDPGVAGQRLTLIVQVVLARGRADIVDSFKQAVRKVPEVQQCYYVTGDVDFILVITARDMSDYEDLTRRLFFDNRDIQKFQTIVVMDTVKLGLEIPL